MKVERVWSNRPDHPATSPFPIEDGFLLELRRGDVLDPYFDPDGWFGIKKPFFTLRFRLRIPLPYIAFRRGRYGFYLGPKIYGVDSAAYAGQFVEASEVYAGSQAMCFTARFSRRVGI